MHPYCSESIEEILRILLMHRRKTMQTLEDWMVHYTGREENENQVSL